MLRSRLQSIADEYVGPAAAEQIRIIADLAREHPHSIRLVQEAVSGQPETGRFNCFQHAFDLIDLPEEVVQVCTLDPHVYPSADFVRLLISDFLAEVTANEAQDGDVIVYSDGEEIRHAGRIDGAQVPIL